MTKSIIKKVSSEDLKLIQPMLNALRTNNIRELAKYEDITVNLEDLLYTYRPEAEFYGKMKKIYNSKKEEIELKAKEREAQLLLDVEYFGYNEKISIDKIKNLINKIIKNSGIEEPYNVIRKRLLKEIMLIEEEKIDIKTKRRPKNKGLLLIRDNALKEKVHIYDKLKENDYIKDPYYEFLPKE